MTNTTEKKYDYIDIQIIRIIDEQFNKLNYSPSTQQISNLLEENGILEYKVPSRTIRYRISKLVEKNIFRRKIPITHERKLGIGESFFIVEENPQNRKKFYEILDENKAIDWYIPTYGKLNGYYIHSIFSLDSHFQPHNVFQLMKEKDIIRDYTYLNLVDYKAFGWNYDYFDINGIWNWEWKIWENYLKDDLRKRKTKLLNFEMEPDRINFDFMDVQILKQLYLDDSLPLKRLGEKLQLSESQVGRRIKLMEQKGIIRGYRTGFYPFANLSPIFILINSKENLNRIITHILEIPYPSTIAFENENKIAVALEIPNNETFKFLNAFYSLKNQIDDYLIQFLPQIPEVNMAEGFNFYEEKENRWNKLNKEYRNTIDHLEKM